MRGDDLVHRETQTGIVGYADGGWLWIHGATEGRRRVGQHGAAAPTSGATKAVTNSSQPFRPTRSSRCVDDGDRGGPQPTRSGTRTGAGPALAGPYGTRRTCADGCAGARSRVRA